MSMGHESAQSATTPSARDRLCQELARRTATSPDDWFLVFKARYALSAVARALVGAGKSDVVTQLFTCCTAVTPFVDAGLHVTYADTSIEHLALDASKLALPSGVGAVVAQHTFGVDDPRETARLASAAHAAGAILVEDSAHRVTYLTTDDEGRPVADVSIHSFGVEKILPTHFGGAVWVNPAMDEALKELVVRELAALPEPSDRLARDASRYLGQMRAINHTPGPLRSAVRAVVCAGGFEEAITDDERSGRMGAEPCRINEWAASRALAALEGLDANYSQRRAAVEAYARHADELSSAGLELASACVRAPAPLLRFPVFACDEARASALVGRLRERGYFVQAWGRPWLFPGALDAQGLCLDGSEATRLPVSARMSAGIVALPTDIAPEVVERLIAQDLR